MTNENNEPLVSATATKKSQQKQQVTQQLKALYAETQDKEFVNKLVKICNMFSVQEIKIIDK